MKTRQKMLALGMAGIMMLPTVQAYASDTAQAAPEWMNTEGTFPIVKEGNEKTLTIYVKQVADAGKPEDTWMYHYLTENMNINLEFTSFTDENRDEFLSLAFASGELPDIIIGGNFSAEELVKYGGWEGQIINIDPYINETYMPNLSSVYEQYPSFKNVVTDSEGNVWSLGFIANPTERGNLSRAFINYDWLDECGLKVPETLDEFIDAMKTFKEKGLAEYPIGGSWAAENPSFYILNALGYTGAGGKGFDICLRDGEVVLPYADRERFGDYLKVMNQLYEEGLIHKDFFTMDYSSTSAELAKGTGFVSQAPFVYCADYTQYWAAMPLTSEYNSTPQWFSNNPLSAGGAVITSSCEEPELAAKFLDYFYDVETDGYRLSIIGPEASQTDLLYDMVGGREQNESGAWLYKDYESNKDSYASANDYLAKKVRIWTSNIIGFDAWTFDKNSPAYTGEEDWSQYEDTSVLRKENEVVSGSAEKCWRVALETVVTEYVAEEVFPKIVYLDADTSEEIKNMKTAMEEYATQEIAKFIIGSKELTDKNLNDYFDTLDSLGASDVVQTYADYYETVK